MHRSLALVLGIASSQLLSAATISTYDQWDKSSQFLQMGELPQAPATAQTWGQTFVAPAGSALLQTFSFWLADMSASVPTYNPLDFEAYLMRWEPTESPALSHATGEILYRSGQRTCSNLPGELRRYDFTDINTELDPEQQYVFFISCSEYYDGIPSQVDPGGMIADPYPFGTMVNLRNGEDTSLFTTGFWGADTSAEMAFEATFSQVVPEPASLSTAAFVLSLYSLAFSRPRRVAR